MNLISKAKLTSVDFRLLTTFANFEGQLSSQNNFYSFIKAYLASKHREDEFNYYWNKTILNSIPDDKVLKNSTEFNTYFASFSISQNMIDAFSKNDSDMVRTILKMNYVLSDDMNSMFEFVFKNKRQYGQIVNNMIKALEIYEASISTETQLIYNISRTITQDNQNFNRFRKLVKKKIEHVKTKLNNESDSEYYNYIIEYRTLSIIMNNCFNDKESLYDYNLKLLDNNVDYIRCNLVFHLFYYAKRSFDFSVLNNFDLRQASYEMNTNSYYILQDNLLNSSPLLVNRILSADPQTIMNIITVLNLVDNMIKNDNIIDELIISSKSLINIIVGTIKEASGRTRKTDIMEKVIDLAKKILSKVENLGY